MNSASPFTLSDAEYLRSQAPHLRASHPSELADATAELQRYLNHYGFVRLFERGLPFTYQLSFESWAGYKIARHCWERPQARATVVVVHGLFDHMGLYLQLVERLLAEGFSVVSFDLPGHGLSSGAPASIEAFREYSNVLAECLQSCQSLPIPHFAVGQSTGCSAIMDFLTSADSLSSHTHPFQRVVLLAPLVRARAWVRISWLHRLVGRFIKQVPRHFGANSHDKNFLHFLAHKDPLQARHIATAWVKAMRVWERIFYSAPVREEQLLVIQGTADATVDWRWNLPLIQQKFPHTRLHYVEGALHHLVCEGDHWRQEVFDSLCCFLRDGVSTGQGASGLTSPC